MPNLRTQPQSVHRIQPEFFPIPQRGADAFFGLGRSSYYDLEKKGLIRLIRIRKPGNLRGKVLVPYDAVSALIHRMGKMSAAQATQVGTGEGESCRT